jgi:hypothetical protein
MAKQTSSHPYLKTSVYRVTKVYVCLSGFILAWVNLQGLHFSWALSAITFPRWISSGATLLATTAVALLDAVPGDHLKAALVFWRWKNPLPGSRAFEKAYLESDHRISITGLREHLGGVFSRSPREQNATWYRLYKTVEAEPAIAGTHYEYLLFRDLTWFTALLATLALVSIATNRELWRELLAYAAIAIVMYVLFARAASERGHRFVRTVLAVVAARPAETKNPELQTL